jgi:hypothetical protein
LQQDVVVAERDVDDPRPREERYAAHGAIQAVEPYVRI